MKKTLAPKLRFPEFREAGEWVESQLGQYLSQHPDYGINAPAVPYSDNLPTYIRITDISEDGYFLRNQMVSVAKKVTDDNYLREGDIVLARTGASVGKSYKYRIEDGKLVFAGFLIRVKPDEKKLNSELLFHFLSTAQYWRWVDFISARSGQPGINGNEYSSMPIPLPPSLKEQQKIAACLSSIDELIAAQSQKTDALKAHKKGLMQQLFPDEGERVPRARFGEFREAGVWEEGKLEEISDFIKDRIPLEQLTLENYVSTENLLPDFAGVTTASKLPPSGSFTRFKVGDILISNIRPYLKKIWFAKKEGAASNDVIIVRAKTKIKSQFLAFLLMRDEFVNYVMTGAKGVKMPRGDISLIKEYPLAFPSSDEQQKIIDCLSSIDELITAQSQKIAALKAHKKGLMQQLFPSTNEENG